MQITHEEKKKKLEVVNNINDLTFNCQVKRMGNAKICNCIKTARNKLK